MPHPCTQNKILAVIKIFKKFKEIRKNYKKVILQIVQFFKMSS